MLIRKTSKKLGGSAMPANFAPLTLGDQIGAHSIECQHAVQKLIEVAPPPVDFSGAKDVVSAAVSGLELAFASLSIPNSRVNAVLSSFDSLQANCTQVYTAAAAADHRQSSKRRLTAFPAWGLFSELAKANGVQIGIRFAAGVAMAVAWNECSRIPEAHATGLRRDIYCNVDIQTLLLEHRNRDLRKLHTWVPHFSTLLEKFRSIYDSSPEKPEPPKIFKQKVDSQLSAAAAHPHPRIRAGVQYKYTLGQQQVEKLVSHIHELETDVRIESSAVLWFAGFACVKPSDLQSIPLLSTLDEDWSLSVDVEAGILKTNWEVLSKDAARGIGIEGQPSSPVVSVPLPSSIADFLRVRRKACPSATKLGDLLPTLRSIEGRESIFPSLAHLSPSWARWSKSPSVILRARGFDALIAGLLCGEPGCFGRAKLYYARVMPSEIWQAAAHAYAVLGWSAPVPMPTGLTAFGSRVVPTDAQILACDLMNLEELEEARPGPRCTWPDLVCFHNLYAKAFCFRLALRLALREYSEMPLNAEISLIDSTVDIAEKSAHDRRGGLPAVMTKGLRSDLKLWLTHIISMKTRVAKLCPNASALSWLRSVEAKAEVPLVQLINVDGTAEPARTLDLFSRNGGARRLASDFGRKWTENTLRLSGIPTGDIDRTMRHDIQGQENYTALSVRIPDCLTTYSGNR
jgi:hypothetical protein